MPGNDWMNEQLRALTGTTVDLDVANDHIREALQPTQPGRSRNQAAVVGPEPDPTASLTDWRRWATEAAPSMDDHGRLPSEPGYTRPAQDSFVAMVERKKHWTQRKAKAAGGAK